MDPQLKAYLDSQFAQLDTQFAGIHHRLDAHDARFDAHDARFDGMDGRLDGIDGRLDGIDSRLDEQADLIQENRQEIHQTQLMLEHLRSDVLAVAEGHAVLNNKLDRLDDRVRRQRSEDRVSQQVEIGALKQRDDALEERIAALEEVRSEP